MKRSTYDLLVGNLWVPNTTKISRLTQEYSLPQIKLSQLRTVVSEATASFLPTAEITTPITIPIAPPKQPDIEESITQQTSKVINPQWSPLIAEISNCEKCKLCYGRITIVIERGSRQAPWMFIGEGPGEQEDLQRKPFVGASGQLLDKMIAAMKLDVNTDIYITNVVKCRPPHNRNPEVDEIAACRNYLVNQINLVNPKLIITLGRFAAQTLLNTELAIGKLRKQVHHYQQIPLIVTYHPSYLLRAPSAKRDAWEDLQLAMQTFATL